MDEWIKCSETPPEPEKKYLICAPFRFGEGPTRFDIIRARLWHGVWEWNGDGWWEEKEVEYYMSAPPLPEPPKDVNSNADHPNPWLGGDLGLRKE